MLNGADLKARLAQARLAWITVADPAGDFKLQVRRPGTLDFLRLAAGRGASTLEAAIDAVRGWEGVTGRHFGEETDDAVPFDRDLVEPLLTDRAGRILALTDGVSALLQAAREADAEKKP